MKDETQTPNGPLEREVRRCGWSDFGMEPDPDGAWIRWDDIPEGCTPEDAMVLRRANHALAAESEKYRTALTRILVGTRTVEMAWQIAHEATHDA